MDTELRNVLEVNGVKVRDEIYYLTAFTHRSFLNEVKEHIFSNERLEFLGDSVLSLIISQYLYLLRSEDTEGELTNLRAYLVKTGSLSKASVKLGLGKFLRLSKGEEMTGGRENTQMMANTYEALLGAIFLDLGLPNAKIFVHNTLISLFADDITDGAPKDAKSLLQEIVQSKLQTSPKYKTISSTGPDHAKHFIVGVFLKGELVGQGEGLNKHTAEEAAARQAIARLEH